MRYDEKAKKINIDYRELVAIAKRGISAPDSFEDEAGSLERPRRALLDTEGKEYHDTPLAYEFSSGGYDFLLSGEATLDLSEEEILPSKKALRVQKASFSALCLANCASLNM